VKNPRHARTCAICKHPLRAEIEADFIRWESPGRIVRRYKLRSRNAIYRHAHALDLFPKRDRNIRAALGWIIEKIGTGKGDGCSGSRRGRNPIEDKRRWPLD
jgi:hypothetical protein